MPIIATLDDLDENSLVKILKEPKKLHLALAKFLICFKTILQSGFKALRLRIPSNLNASTSLSLDL